MDKFKRAIVGAGSIALLSNLFLYRAIGVTGIALSLLFFVLYICLVYGRRLLQPFSVTLIAFTGLFLGLSVVRATGVIQILLLGTSCINIALLLFLSASELRFFRAVRDILILPLALAGSYLVGFAQHYLSSENIITALFGSKTSGISRKIFSLIGGICIGVPVVFLLVSLLSSADPIFGKVIHDFVAHFSLGTIGIRAIVTSLTFVFVLPLALLKINPNFWRLEKANSLSFLLSPMSIVMTMVAITMALFLIIQWPYVFANVAAETDLSKFGIATYSEYVNKGFGEFLVVAGLLYSLLWVGLLAVRSKLPKFHPLLAIQSVVIVLFFVYIASIARRILLYWDFHGLSLIRVYGGMFLLWVSFLAIMVWLRHFVTKRYVVAEVFGTLLLVTFLGFWNAEQFIESHHPPTVNKNIDFVYLSRLSADGYDGWIDAYKAAKAITRNPDLLQKPVLSEEDRRELSYAGMALSMITQQYDQLTNQYGSQTEQQTYHASVFGRESPRFQETSIIFQTSLTTLKSNIQATVAAERYVSQLDGRNKTDEIGQNADSLRRANIDLIQHPTTFTFTPRSAMTVAQFDGSCESNYGFWIPGTEPSYLCVPSFYVLQKTDQSKTPTTLDRLYIWNGAEAVAYSRLIHDIPLPELLQTQSEYLTLWKKILAQPDRQVNSDISFDAPLVKDLW